MAHYIVQMGMDEFTIDEREFSAILRCDNAFERFICLRDIEGKLRWVNINQIKMIEEVADC